MKKVEKQLYSAPSATFYKIAQQGVLCQSGNTEGYSDGNSYGDDDFNSN